MNPVIVAPDGFDVVDQTAGSAIQSEQRHLLGSIARMLQHAAVNKQFHGEGYHVRTLNQYISQTHSRFRSVMSIRHFILLSLCRSTAFCPGLEPTALKFHSLYGTGSS